MIKIGVGPSLEKEGSEAFVCLLLKETSIPQYRAFRNVGEPLEGYSTKFKWSSHLTEARYKTSFARLRNYRAVPC